MFEIHDLSPAAMKTELEYRRTRLTGPRQREVVTSGRWWRRREYTGR